MDQRFVTKRSIATHTNTEMEKQLIPATTVQIRFLLHQKDAVNKDSGTVEKRNSVLTNMKNTAVHTGCVCVTTTSIHELQLLR